MGRKIKKIGRPDESGPLMDQLQVYKELSAQLDVIIDSSYDGMWICDSECRVVRINPASERMSGLRQEEVAGRCMDDLVAEGYFDRSVSREVLNKGTAVTLMQQLQDGRRVLVTGNPVFDSRGRIRLVVCNSRDMTELNQLQRELAETRHLTSRYRDEISRLLHTRRGITRVVARSAIMQDLLESAMRVAAVDSGVFITGESGVGKGMLAEIIHKASPRSKAAMIRINCGAIPESLMEAEFFGYVPGAFTGAGKDGKAGHIELADGGTLFLDEVGELPTALQVKLLRFLEDGEFTRLGERVLRRVDVRLVAATNRNPEDMVRSGVFREDLFYRLNVVPLRIPPLRERPEDIPPLIHQCLEEFNERYKKKRQMTADVVDRLCRHPFPGNIRELRNTVERMAVLSPGNLITPEDLPASIRASSDACVPFDKLRERAQTRPASAEGPPELVEGLLVSVEGRTLKDAVAALEYHMIESALAAAGSQRAAARLLGIDHSTLSRKIRKLRKVK